MGGINSLDGLDNENADSQPALKNARAEAVEELRAAFNELKSGEGLTRLVGGHGVQSRVFEFEWSEPALGISFRMPYARVLSDEASQKDDDEEIGAAIRMAILLLMTAECMESVSRIEVSCDDRGTTPRSLFPSSGRELRGASGVTFVEGMCKQGRKEREQWL